MDDRYGKFSINESGLIYTFKLVHRSGSLRCHPQYPATYWGCVHPWFGERDQLLTVITDRNRSPLLLADYSRKGYVCGYKYYSYHLEGIDVNSPELLFNRLSPPLPVSFAQEFQIWYGEDLTDCEGGNNSGETCADVYAWYV